MDEARENEHFVIFHEEQKEKMTQMNDSNFDNERVREKA